MLLLTSLTVSRCTILHTQLPIKVHVHAQHNKILGERWSGHDQAKWAVYYAYVSALQIYIGPTVEGNTMTMKEKMYMCTFHLN